MGLLKALPILGLLLLGLAIYFFLAGNLALGAAMIALASSQVAVFVALSANARADERGRD